MFTNLRAILWWPGVKSFLSMRGLGVALCSNPKPTRKNPSQKRMKCTEVRRVVWSSAHSLATKIDRQALTGKGACGSGRASRLPVHKEHLHGALLVDELEDHQAFA